jgi:hypothetical protein
MITNFNSFKNESIILKESINLTDDEKKYLWNKIEYKKKKNAIDTENNLFKLLNGNQKTFDNDDFDLILKSLEYTFKKKISGLDNPINNDIFKSIQDKIPNNWIPIKYSSLSAKEKRKPNITWDKDEIKKYINDKNIKFDDNLNKKELLDLIK